MIFIITIFSSIMMEIIGYHYRFSHYQLDKGSVVIAMLLASLILKEMITARMLIGAAFIVTGLIIIAKKT